MTDITNENGLKLPSPDDASDAEHQPDNALPHSQLGHYVKEKKPSLEAVGL